MKPLTDKQQRFLIAYCDGHPSVIAAQAAGVSPRTARRLLAKPGFRSLIRQRARDIISNAAPRAAKRLDELMSQDDSKAVSKDAAIALLAIDGIKAPQAPAAPIAQVNIGIGVWDPPPSGRCGVLETLEDYDYHIAQTKKHGPAQGPGYELVLGDPKDPEIAKRQAEIERLHKEHEAKEGQYGQG